MKDLKAKRGAFYIRRLIEEGEHQRQDFKFAINDARKIARTLSAFANRDGGRLLVGVKDNGVIAGIRSEEDIFVVEQAAELYCRPTPEVRFDTFACENGAIVLRVEIDRYDERPVLASEPDGRWRAYYRVADENILAHPLMVAGWRRALADEPVVIALGAEERRVMEAVGGDGAISPADLPRRCGLSQRLAGSIVERLYALGVVDFDYRHPDGFVITSASSSPE